MKEVWGIYDDFLKCVTEYYDSEETARFAYYKWCKENFETPDEQAFKDCYKPLSELVTILTINQVASKKYHPW